MLDTSTALLYLNASSKLIKMECLFFLVMILMLFKTTCEESVDGKGSNLDIVMELQQAEISGLGSGDSLEKIPEFKDRQSEIRWKLNKVRKQLNSAKTYTSIARRMKESLKKGVDKSQKEIEKIIEKAEKSLVRTGEQMGLDYMHFKRDAESNFKRETK